MEKQKSITKEELRKCAKYLEEQALTYRHKAIDAEERRAKIQDNKVRADVEKDAEYWKGKSDSYDASSIYLEETFNL